MIKEQLTQIRELLKQNTDLIDGLKVIISEMLAYMEKLEKRNQIMREALERTSTVGLLENPYHIAKEALKKEKEVV